MADVLLTVSGVIAADIEAQIAQQRRPRADYIELARAFGADLLDYGRAHEQSGWFGHLLSWIGGPNLLLAWCCYRYSRRYRVIFTDGEQVGIPYALLCRLFGRRGAAHLMIAHILSAPKKRLLFDLFRLEQQIDRFFVYATWQKRFIEQRWRVPADRVVFTPFMVDNHFFAPTPAPTTVDGEVGVTSAGHELAGRKACPLICAVGLEFRDYPTLLKAVRGLAAEVVIAAASPWSKRADTTAQEAIPPNVTVRRYSQYDLRQLYADCCFVVMPLYNVEFQAGVTAILEAMAMGKAVICSQTPGQTDIIVDGVTGRYVSPGDVAALRSAMEALLADPEGAARMGQAGRARVEADLSLDCYTARLQSYVHQALQVKDHSQCATNPAQSMRPL